MPATRPRGSSRPTVRVASTRAPAADPRSHARSSRLRDRDADALPPLALPAPQQPPHPRLHPRARG